MSQPNHDNTPPRDSEHWEELRTENQSTIHIEVEAFADANFRPLPEAILKEIQVNHRSAPQQRT
jgi:hypothetical protein